MSDKVFLDTNILVYAYDDSHPKKQKQAQILLLKSIEEENGWISVQVLGEFFSVVTKKIQQTMSPEEAGNTIELFSIMHVVEIDAVMVGRAIGVVKQYRISYWDALIIAAAERSGCRMILTEDLNHGQIYNEIQAVNPFIFKQNLSS